MIASERNGLWQHRGSFPLVTIKDIEGEPQDYWSTMGGIMVRLEMFGHQLEWGTFNGAVKITASSIGIFDFMVTGPADERNCEWCAEHNGRVYRQGQFMPDLPKHPNCRHLWDISYIGEK